MIYTVTLNPALDYYVHLADFATGKTNRAIGEKLLFGGKGINVSAVLSALGEPTVAFLFAAGATGAALCAALTDCGVPHEPVILPEGQTRINVKIKAGEESEINAAGPDVPSESLCALLDKLDTLKKGDTLVLAGSVPRTVPRDIYEQMILRVRDREVRVVVDAERELLLRTLPYRPFLIKPNLGELCEIAGAPLTTDGEITDAARALQAAGAQNVLVSLGGKGALLLDEYGKVHRAPAVGGAPVNTVGAGDSMVAGFLCGVPEGYAHALRLGTAAGGATATSVGLATAGAISALLREL